MCVHVCMCMCMCMSVLVFEHLFVSIEYKSLTPMYPCAHVGEEEGDEPVILTDILGLEDALGTMDFKGTHPCLGLCCVALSCVVFSCVLLDCFMLCCIVFYYPV